MPVHRNNMYESQPNRMTGRLPDFIFLRRRDIELECGFPLAGNLVTDVPEGGNLSKRDHLFMRRILDEPQKLLKSAPDFDEASFWRQPVRPPDGLSPPFDEQLLKERARRCVCVMFTVGTSPSVKVPSDLERQIFGGAVN